MPPRARRIWSHMSESFWVLLVSLVVLFTFLLMLGAYSAGEVLVLTLVMVGLFVLWIGHAVWVARRAEGRDPRAVAARERRGF